jgi:hypothetical protein
MYCIFGLLGMQLRRNDSDVPRRECREPLGVGNVRDAQNWYLGAAAGAAPSGGAVSKFVKRLDESGDESTALAFAGRRANESETKKGMRSS